MLPVLDRVMLRHSLVAWLFWFSVVGVGVLAVQPGETLPGRIFDLWDKAQHALAFSALTFLGLLAFRCAWMQVVFGLLCYGALIELVQFFLPWRSCEVLDFIADAVGVGLVVVVAKIQQRT